MTGGYGGPDIITSCTVDVNKGEIVSILGPKWCRKIYSNEGDAWLAKS